VLPVEADVIGKGSRGAVVGGAVRVVVAQGQRKVGSLAAFYNDGLAAFTGLVEFVCYVRRVVRECRSLAGLAQSKSSKGGTRAAGGGADGLVEKGTFSFLQAMFWVDERAAIIDARAFPQAIGRVECVEFRKKHSESTATPLPMRICVAEWRKPQGNWCVRIWRPSAKKILWPALVPVPARALKAALFLG
jgi:hypothetical protein